MSIENLKTFGKRPRLLLLSAAALPRAWSLPGVFELVLVAPTSIRLRSSLAFALLLPSCLRGLAEPVWSSSLGSFGDEVVADKLLHLADPFAEADEDAGETKQSQNYIHIRIQRKSSTPGRLAADADVTL